MITISPLQRYCCGRSRALSVLAALILLGLSSQLHAGIMVGDWKTSGDALLTVDTTQGLEFLDLTESFGRSFSDVSSQFGAGGDFEGFRYATEQEAVNLINEIGWSGTPAFAAGNTSQTVFGNADAESSAVINLLGSVSGNAGFFANKGGSIVVAGMTSTDISGDKRLVEVWRQAPILAFARSQLNYDGSGHVDIGSFLVRPVTSSSAPGGGVVPEPSSFAMFALAGIGLVGARRRKN